jgi:formylglycine-generating enzyme required for sulfatase activity
MGNKVFLSHNSEDKSAVERLAEKLEAAGFVPWLDRWNLIPGDPWQPALESALKECDVCAVFLGPNQIGPWQNEEMQLAINPRVHDKQFRVVPILLPNTPRGKRGDVPAFLANVTWIEFRDSLDDAYQFKRLINSLHGLPTRPDRVQSATGDCPYKGLQTFDIGDAGCFFGREALTDWLVADVRRLLESDREPRFLAIVGASGSGKSSVARAGLLYELEQGAIAGSDQWARIIVDHPGADPITELFTVGRETLGLPYQDSIQLDEQYIAPIKRDKERVHALHRQTDFVLSNQPGKRLLLFIDQFEEIFTACHDKPLRERFVDLILHAARAAGGKVMVIITIRMDFLGRCVDLSGLDALISGGMELVGAMNDNELEDAIARPARMAGVEVSSSLTQQLIQDVRKQPGSLPLLEHVLTKLWQQKTGDRITDADCTLGIKGIEGALAAHADEILAQKCGSEARQQQVLALLTRLVHISDVAAPETDTRLRYPIDEAEYQLIKPFLDARLLIASAATGAEPGPQKASETRILEVAHEALIRHWPRLQAAIKDRQFTLWRERLSTAAGEWRQTKNPDRLLEGQKLGDAKRWLKLKQDEMNELEIAFIRRSLWASRGRRAKTAAWIVAPLVLTVWFFIWSAAHFSSPMVGLYVLLAKAGIRYGWLPTMVPIPPDQNCTPQNPCKFSMDSPDSETQANANEKPVRTVRFTNNFNLSETEITFEQYEVFAYFAVQEGGCKNKEGDGEPHVLGAINNSGFGNGQRPAINVNWYDAECYAQWLTKKTDSEKRPFRLPTEAEWEYAARAGTNSVFYWGADDPKNNAWFDENSGNKTQPVRQKKPNNFDLYDMSGNVFEWVQDCWHDNYNSAPTDGTAWEQQNEGDCETRVLRGGS